MARFRPRPQLTPHMNPFDDDTVAFLGDLARHNDRDWFAANKGRYERHAKAPFTAFTEHMIARIREHDPSITIAPADAIFRINRDVRFSKDKSPYKTHLSANISRFGRRDKAYPGFYYQIGADGVLVAGGAYAPDRPQLERIRELIAAEPDAFLETIEGDAFRAHFGELQGERQKRLAGIVKEHAERIPWIANKQFFYQAAMPVGAITSPALADELLARYLGGKPLNDFLARAF